MLIPHSTLLAAWNKGLTLSIPNPAPVTAMFMVGGIVHLRGICRDSHTLPACWAAHTVYRNPLIWPEQRCARFKVRPLSASSSSWQLSFSTLHHPCWAWLNGSSFIRKRRGGGHPMHIMYASHMAHRYHAAVPCLTLPNHIRILKKRACWQGQS